MAGRESERTFHSSLFVVCMQEPGCFYAAASEVMLPGKVFPGCVSLCSRVSFFRSEMCQAPYLMGTTWAQPAAHETCQKDSKPRSPFSPSSGGS